jgi:site-specific recombinase XerD
MEKSLVLLDAIQRFLLSLEANGRAERTIGSYRQRLAGFLDFVAEARGPVRLNELGPEDLDAWVVSLRRAGCRYQDHPVKPVEDGGLSEATIAGRIQAVKAFFSWCVERGYLDRSPARHLKRPRPARSARSKLMTLGDLLLIESEAEKRAESGQPRDLALVRFVADTGCRRGEVVSLRVSNLDLGLGEALVKGKTTHKDDYRPVEFGPRTAEALRAWLTIRPDVEHDRVFVSLSNDPARYGRPLGVNGVYQVFKRLAAAAGVMGKFNPHALRHLVGQHFTDETNLELARQKLGHKDISTTAEFYAHQDRERVKRATRVHSLLNHHPGDDE